MQKPIHANIAEIMEKRKEEQHQTDNRIIQKHGWVIHSEPGLSYHTHGLAENFNHPDLEIAMPIIEPYVAHDILTGLFRRIKAGIKYQPGQETNSIAGIRVNYPPPTLPLRGGGLRATVSPVD